MPDITILTEAELRQQVQLDDGIVDVVENAFAALSTGRVVMPPVMSMAIPQHNGEVDVKTAYVDGLDGFAVKVSPGFFDNPKLGLSSLNGLMVLFSARTGIVEAALLDNGYLTDIRTAAAGAAAARYLARKTISTAGVLGAGVQAELQMRALALVRPFKTLLVWARDQERANAFAEQISASLGVAARAVPAAEDCVSGADLVVTTTPARAPFVEADWLHPGLHITAMGSDAAEKNELAPAVIADADLYVCDSVSQCRRIGELHHAIAADAVADRAVPELGDIVAGRHPGRTADDQVTICDLTGTGIQDTAIAMVAYQRSRDAGIGTVIAT